MKKSKTSNLSIGISNFFQLPINVALVRILPFSVIRIYLYILGALYFLVAYQQTIRITKSFNYVFQPNLKRPSSYLQFIKAYAGVFEHYYEKLLLGYKSIQTISNYLGKRLVPSFPDSFKERIDNQQGCILVTGHFGAVEFLPLASGMLNIKIAMIVRFKTEELRKALQKKADHYDVFVIDADKPNVIKKAMQAIKDGRVLITECDEFSKWHPNKKLSLSVFGKRFQADRTLDFFYKKAKVPAYLCLMKRENGNYRMVIDPIADGKSPNVSLAINAWKRLEGYILNYPEQWYQWKSAYSLLEKHILQGQTKEQQVMGTLEPTVQHSAH